MSQDFRILLKILSFVLGIGWGVFSIIFGALWMIGSGKDGFILILIAPFYISSKILGFITSVLFHSIGYSSFISTITSWFFWLIFPILLSFITIYVLFSLVGKFIESRKA